MIHEAVSYVTRKSNIPVINSNGRIMDQETSIQELGIGFLQGSCGYDFRMMLSSTEKLYISLHHFCCYHMSEVIYSHGSGVIGVEICSGSRCWYGTESEDAFTGVGVNLACHDGMETLACERELNYAVIVERDRCFTAVIQVLPFPLPRNAAILIVNNSNHIKRVFRMKEVLCLVSSDHIAFIVYSNTRSFTGTEQNRISYPPNQTLCYIQLTHSVQTPFPSVAFKRLDYQSLIV